MVQRITYRRRLSYNTKSNKRKVVRTPGGKLVFQVYLLILHTTTIEMTDIELKLLNFQYLKKRPSVPKCPMTGLKLKGVTPATNQEKARISRRQKTVFRLPAVLIFFSQSNFATIRAYGGVLSHKAVREKIVRAFLIEEQKIVMKVLKAQGKN